MVYFTIVKEEKVSRLKLKALATVNSRLVFPRRRSGKDIVNDDSEQTEDVMRPTLTSDNAL